MHQLVGGGDGHAQRLRHQLRIEEQRQVVVAFTGREFQCNTSNLFKCREKTARVPEVPLGLCSETQRAVELLQQFSGLFVSGWPPPYPFLPCLTYTAFAFPWYAHLGTTKSMTLWES